MEVKSVTGDVSDLMGMTRFLKVNLITAGDVKTTRQTAIFLLDRSGSMSGRPLEEAKKAIENMVDVLFETHDIYLIVYAGYKYAGHWGTSEQIPDFDVHNFVGKPKKDILTTVRNISHTGNTSFTVAMNAVKNLVDRFKTKSQTSIIFFTDGEDTCERSAVALSNLPGFVKKLVENYRCMAQGRFGCTRRSSR